MLMSNLKQDKIAIVGLGYVGLPLAIEFSKKFPVVGFDINNLRIQQLRGGYDETLEVDLSLQSNLIKQENDTDKGLYFSSSLADIESSNIFIITVPTPINDYQVPDLNLLLTATKMVASVLKKGDLVIYESTVFPGCTEEECVPLLEKKSTLQYNKDFFVGYSPERINPGDKINTLVNITKVTSGSTENTAERVDNLYKEIIIAGTYKAASIQVAEAAKAIENAQRDINISFVNELALIFDRLGIDTQDVLNAAGTKYNFLPFKPGLVGGHCISVDPIYLAHKATQMGYQPNVILSGRRVNEQMASFIASKVVKLMTAKDITIKGAKVLILGITFKENCPDIRNSKVVDIYRELQDYGVKVDVYDPWANPDYVAKQYDINLLESLEFRNKEQIKETVNFCNNRDHKFMSRNSDAEFTNLVQEESINPTYDAIVLAVAHKQFMNLDVPKLAKSTCVIFDTKGILDRSIVDARL